MRKKIIRQKIRPFLLLACGASFLFSACSKEQFREAELDSNSRVDSSVSIKAETPTIGLPGQVYIKVSASAEQNMRVSRETGQLSLNSVPSPMSAVFSSIGAEKAERVFPYAGKYEKRTQREGLHRWFVVHFDDKRNLDEVISMFQALEEVEVSEKVYATEIQGTPVPVSPFSVTGAMSKEEANSRLPFNDPQLIDQWHYRNFGLHPNFSPGADINLFEAWKFTTGTPNVIVNVVDGFIDVLHEDLIDNLWVNKGEIPDNGIDDDGNGYIDDVNGFNFVADHGTLDPDDVSHGTHVAGTVAARNNNGIGVSGVAGGDGSPGSGVKLMNSQIFRHERENGNSPAAIKYGADNGAVISQNSWGYRYPGPGAIPNVIRDAIDYFIKYAGCDNEGNQLPDSPMKGGVVIFAAGNDNKDFKSYPSAYPPVISVSAMAPNWKKAYYTTRGDWVTLMAPGGDYHFGPNGEGEVLSTLSPRVPSTNGKKYGYMQGTSMACPHVSGIAALVVSYYGGPGFTNEQLKKILTNSYRPGQNVNQNNPGFEGRLGAGYIDAAEAFVKDLNKNPKAVDKVDVESDFLYLDLSWRAVEDEDDGSALYYKLYRSNKPFTKSDIDNGKVPETLINAVGFSAGTLLTRRIAGLESGTKYHFAIQSIDRWGHESPVYNFSASTKENHPPILEGVPSEPVRVSVVHKASFEIKVTEPDDQTWYFELEGETKGVSAFKTKTGISFTIRAIASVGIHKLTLKVRDELNMSVEQEIPFEVYVYEEPKLISPFEHSIIGVNEGVHSFPLDKHFQHDKYIDVEYKAVSYDERILTVETKGEELLVTPIKAGKTSVKVTLSDGFGKPVYTNFEIQVVDNIDAPVYLVYPLPVTKELNLLLNPAMKNAHISIRSVRGEEVLRQDVKVGFTGLVKLNLSKFSVGSYTLQVSGEKGSYKKTFVKL